MREIKFRAWNKEENILVYSNEDLTRTYWDGARASDIEMVNARFKNNDYVWMQYTGLKDKSGVEIYEGDIVSYMDGADISSESGYDFYEYRNTGVIEWSEDEARYSLTGRGAIDLETFWEEIEDSLIIGNIYENPELLKGGETDAS